MAETSLPSLSAFPSIAWHFDLHTPGSVRVHANPDPKGIATELKRHRIPELILFAKCHFGFSYYPTRTGTPHPRMKGDLFGDILKACRQEGLRVMAYMSFGIDGQAGALHPEWKRTSRDGRTDPDGYFTYLSRTLDGKWPPIIPELTPVPPPMCSSWKACLEKSPGTVELVLWEHELTTWAIFIQHGGEQLVGKATPFTGLWGRTLSHLPRAEVGLRLTRSGAFPRRVTQGGVDVSWKEKDGFFQIQTTIEKPWNVIRIDWNDTDFA